MRFFLLQWVRKGQLKRVSIDLSGGQILTGESDNMFKAILMSSGGNDLLKVLSTGKREITSGKIADHAIARIDMATQAFSSEMIINLDIKRFDTAKNAIARNKSFLEDLLPM